MESNQDQGIAVELREISKRFGTCVANAHINLKVKAGSIHGVIGENGAGKSTSMKILYGLYPPTTGKIFVEGVERHWKSPRDAIAAGIGMVHQHFMLAGPYTALDNIILGTGPVRLRHLPLFLNFVDRRAGLKKLEELSQKHGLQVDFQKKIEALPVGIQQRVEILKLLYNDAKILILDEPTAVLTPQETLELFDNLRKLRDEGHSIIVITHKLREVMDLTDHVTIFRGGNVVGERVTKETNDQELADLMVGRKVALQVAWPDPAPTPAATSEESLALEVKNLSLFTQQKQKVNFHVKRGEIVGIAGVEGNGQSELIHSLLFTRKNQSGGNGNRETKILGTVVNHCTPREIRELGVGVVPEDRHDEGLLLQQALDENFLLGYQGNSLFNRWGFLRWPQIRKSTEDVIEQYDVRPQNYQMTAHSLSGGNQQKLIIGREFFRDPQFLICAHPTRGVDVGAIEFIHQKILQARKQGAGILLISSELEEVMGLSDRILVLYQGAVAAEFSRGEWDEKTLGFYMGGG